MGVIREVEPLDRLRRLSALSRKPDHRTRNHAEFLSPPANLGSAKTHNPRPPGAAGKVVTMTATTTIDQVPQVAPFQSCIACFRGDTTTGVALKGEAEFCIAGLIVLGVPEDQALGTFHVCMEAEGWTGQPDEVPGGEVTLPIRLCRECAAKTPFAVGQVPSLPFYVQPDEQMAA